MLIAFAKLRVQRHHFVLEFLYDMEHEGVLVVVNYMQEIPHVRDTPQIPRLPLDIQRRVRKTLKKYSLNKTRWQAYNHPYS